MRNNKIIYLTISCATCFLLGIFSIVYAQQRGQNNQIIKRDNNPARQKAIVYNPENDSIILTHEFRGAWVTTVSATDWPKNKIILQKISDDESNREMRRRIQRQIDSQKLAIVEMFTALKEAGINALMFHTVSNSDAMYPSKILPWSTHLTGHQGGDPGYDPLGYAIDVAHNLGLEIHAWLNPLRIGFNDLERTADHPHKLYPELVQTVGRTMYWDPSHPEVIEYLYNLVTELMINYNLDGIHIDDYFYPDGLRDGGAKGWDDSKMYEKDGNGLSLDKWREKNVNNIVRAMYSATHDANPDAVFSVSPGGRLVNTQKLYADPQYWIEEGTIDFLAPQIYWQHGHKIADFKKVLDSWKDIMKDIPTIPGLAPYRWGEKNAFENLEEYDLQIKECREADYVYGNIWFTTGSILQPDFARHMRENFYKYPSLTPNLRRFRESKQIASPQLSAKENRLSWNNIKGATEYAVYQLEVVSRIVDRKEGKHQTIWRANLINVSKETSLKVDPQRNYAVLAIAGKDKSPLSNVVFVE